MGCCQSLPSYFAIFGSSDDETQPLLPNILDAARITPHPQPPSTNSTHEAEVIRKERVRRVLMRTQENLINISASAEKEIGVEAAERESEYRNLLGELNPPILLNLKAPNSSASQLAASPDEGLLLNGGVSQEEAEWMRQVTDDLVQALKKVEVREEDQVVMALSW
ncbi:uncharacterized protein VTP21DRAFT_6948 [Calcarisporiella thermophila]|uniref:uncharacterized protein n=1 Tax=Calcarisporiella thermophila TaxID=911321 RepID=UPI00374316BE